MGNLYHVMDYKIVLAMGFFFQQRAKVKATAKPRGALKIGGGGGSRAKQNEATLRRLGCAGCPLNKAPVDTPKMLPTLAKRTLVYFLGEAPGQDEDERSHKPFTGPSGKLLRQCIPDQYTSADCSFDNTINCRPENNRTPTWNEMQCCHPRRVQFIEQAKPKVILGTGLVPLNWILNSTDMVGMRGRVFTVKVGSHVCYFIPTYHPSFILRINREQNKKFGNKAAGSDPLRSRLGVCFKFDVEKAFEVAEKWPEPRFMTEGEIRAGIQCFDGSYPDHYKELIELLGQATAAPVKAIDLETKGLRPYAPDAAIMTCGISFDDTHFSFALDHPHTCWDFGQRSGILADLKILLQDDTQKVAHNAPFELEWFIWLFGEEVVNHVAWNDTQVQAHILDERRGKKSGGDDTRRAAYQKLDFLVKQHFGIAFKGLFKLNIKDMSKSDLDETMIYNGADTKTTLALWHRQNQLLEYYRLREAYEEALPRQASVALMQWFGISTNQQEVKRIQARLEDEISEVIAEINDLKVVKAYIKDHREFNPHSNPDLERLFVDYLKAPEVLVDGKFSADKAVLGTIDHPIAPLLITLRNRSKLKSTYVDNKLIGAKDAVVWADGVIHPNFNTTFAETGRTSCDGPNMQNEPQRNDAWVRTQIEAQAGHVLVAFDYGQLEACTTAMCTKDKKLVDFLSHDKDIHTEWTHKLVEEYPEATDKPLSDEKAFEKLRSRIKNKLVFPAFFGAQSSSIAGYLGIPEEPVEALMKDFWREFEGVASWQKQTMRFYYDMGYVPSPTGRRHRYPLTRNEAINFPIQSFACDIVCNAMNWLSQHAARTGQWYLHPRLNIHDDLTFSIPDDDNVLEEAIKLIYTAMLSPPYKQINVPLSCKGSIGKSWYNMEKLGQFWSHRDI